MPEIYAQCSAVFLQKSLNFRKIYSQKPQILDANAVKTYGNYEQAVVYYGYGNVGRFVYQELLRSGYTVSGVIDTVEHAEVTTLPLDKIEAVGADIIVVTPVYDFYRIKQEWGSHCNAQIVSAMDIV